MATDTATVKRPGREAGPGAIRVDEKRYAEFAKIWNETEEPAKDVKGGITHAILANLRKAGIANKDTDEAQVRAFATKVRNAGQTLRVFAQRLDRKKILIAWMTSKSPSEAFQKCINGGVFGAAPEDANEKDSEWRKQKLQSFRACIAQMRKQEVPLRKMGRTRTAKIDNGKFAEIWNSCDSVSEVKEKLVAANLASADVKVSALKSKAATLRKGKKNEDDDTWAIEPMEMKIIKSRESIDALKKLAMQLAAGGEFVEDEDEDEDEDEAEVEETEEEDDEDAEVEDDDDAGLGELADL